MDDEVNDFFRFEQLMRLWEDGDMGSQEQEEFVNLFMKKESQYERFYLTFGAQYDGYNLHPRGDHVHKDGYVLITARDYNAARAIVEQLYGLYWSDLYAEADFASVREWFPRGALLRIEVPLNTVEDA